jgi:hypothetical protein
MHVRTIHVYAHELLPGTQQRFVPCLGRLGHDEIEDGIAHPPRARNDDGTKGGIRVWDMSQERLVECIVEAREALLVGSRGTSTLAWDWDVDALEYDGHMLGEQAKCRSA